MTILLTKDMGPADLPGVTKIRIGGAWDTSTGGAGRILGRIRENQGTDLDVIGILMSGDEPVRYVGLDNPDPLKNGSVLHSGDNTTGKGDGDDETIDVEFARVPATITAIYFGVYAFKRGSSFSKAKNVDFNIYDGTGGSYDLVANTMPSLLGNHNAHKVLRTFRDGGDWKLEVVNEKSNIEQGNTDSLLRFAMR